jgi:hypothetical protein
MMYVATSAPAKRPVKAASLLLLETTSTVIINKNEIMSSETSAALAPFGPGAVIA